MLLKQVLLEQVLLEQETSSCSAVSRSHAQNVAVLKWSPAPANQSAYAQPCA